MNYKKIFSHGISVYLTLPDGWKSEKFKAYLQPIRYKTKVYLEGDYTEIGINDNEVFLFLCPSDHQIVRIADKVLVVDEFQNKYKVDKAERVLLDNKCIYTWCVIRKLMEVK